MAHPASQSSKYFLGVNGQQSGPHSESEIVDKIRSGIVPADALIWFDGLSDWQSVQAIPAFSGAFARGAAPPPAGVAPVAPPSESPFKPMETPATQSYTPSRYAAAQPETSTFAQGEGELVFNPERTRGRGPSRMMVILAASVAIVAILGGVAYYEMEGGDPLTLKSKPKPAAPLSRDVVLRKALSELLLNPSVTLETLKKLVAEKPTDDVATQATNALVEYYRIHSPVDAGRVLVSAKRPEEAVKYFLMEPADYEDAEKSLAQAVDATPDRTKKKQLLYQQIDLLLGPLNQKTKAVERIRFLDANFPGDSQPYSYYLKSTDEKLRDIFARISFYFVKNLMAYFDSELPQINLVSRPLVELKKDKDNHYRVVGSYSGDINLNHDHLNNIFFQFWLEKDQWVLVDTNITAERQNWTKTEKERLKNTALSGESMLQNLEQIFRTQFPRNAVHDHVAQPTKPVAPE